MRKSLVLLLCLALSFSAGSALAFKNIEGCDLVACAAKGSPIAIPPERWQAYRAAAEAILANAPQSGASLQAWRALADRLIEAQANLLQPVKATPAYQDYLAGDSCRVLAKLNSGEIASLLDEVSQSTPEHIASALRQVIEAARTQIDRIERTARFTSNRARILMAARYYCFVAAAIMAFLPPERRAELTLDDFGETISCQDAGRTG